MGNNTDVGWAVLLVVPIAIAIAFAVIKSGESMPAPERGMGCKWVVLFFVGWMLLATACGFKEGLGYIDPCLRPAAILAVAAICWKLMH